MTSIKSKLVYRLTALLASVLVVILLFTDISVDRWLEEQFNASMLHKANTLITLVEMDEEGVEFEFAGEFMPEFERKDEAEFYQLWLGNEVFERSDSLDFYPGTDLPASASQHRLFVFSDYDLPDGRNGRLLSIYFVPQVEDEFEAELAASQTQRSPMIISYAITTDALDFNLIVIDVAFLFTALITTFLVFQLVSKIVTSGLRPMSQLNKQLQEIDIKDGTQCFEIQEPAIEVNMVVVELNRFLNENRRLIQAEHRLTSDIAHELKTPITELINLAEVAIRYPDNQEVNGDFKGDTLDIAKRLKNIVESLLLLNRAGSDAFKLHKTSVNVSGLLQDINRSLSIKHKIRKGKVNIETNHQYETVQVDQFCIESVLSNLMDNAITYSPQDAPVDIITSDTPSAITITITNDLIETLEEKDLQLLFEPLWQKDASRTSREHFGLGLAIVKSITDRAEFSLSVTLPQVKQISFKLTIPLK